jgi:hypothetical protein
MGTVAAAGMSKGVKGRGGAEGGGGGGAQEGRGTRKGPESVPWREESKRGRPLLCAFGFI